ncbi:MAG TPA: peptidoglycan-binding domain-containing protein [Solirubrobacteraceae bacterium]|nr:peptidoglycan-binding domain-containing protein [Solirubrobacteraceae bacterium]
MASTGAHKRSTSAAAAAVALLLCVLGLPMLPAAAANIGGTAPPASPGAPPASSGAGAPTAHVKSVRITSVSCVPAPRCSGNPHQVSVHGTLLLGGIGLKSGMIVVFPATPGARISVRRPSPATRLRASSAGLIVTVPKNAHSGRIMVLIGHGRYTSVYGPISIYKHALHPPAPPSPPAAPADVGAVSGTAFDGQGMWIWYLSQSNGGSVASIVAQAHAAGVSTLFVKSSDGSSNYWSQFSPQLVQELHAGGLRVCGWQYVYGTNPKGEAALGAEAAANGADCLVIDAEAEYEGRYAAAQTYIAELRARVGPSYPIALASFPYVSYHPSEPYSVFLGPGAAQYNAPQRYWKDIGVSVDTIYANPYIGNRIYGRPIFPLGQTYGGVSSSDLLRFREESVDYGATGLSFWDWQETGAGGWSTLAAPLAPLTSVTPNTEYPELRSGRKGDQVLWLQEHLASAIPSQEVTGNFGSQTTANLQAFQTAHGIPPTGVAEPATWNALLALPPVAVDWTGGGPKG